MDSKSYDLNDIQTEKLLKFFEEIETQFPIIKKIYNVKSESVKKVPFSNDSKPGIIPGEYSTFNQSMNV